MNNTSKQEFSKKLLEWWKENKQDFPWRNTKNPYKILVAEMLLRKTTAKQVNKLFEKFLLAYPTPKKLSKATHKKLVFLLKPLGMEHIRSQQLKKMAIHIFEKYNGKIPDNEEELTKLPGIGKYSANSILSIIYHYDVPMVDVNAIRITQRVFSYESPKKRLRDDMIIWKFIEDLIPKGKSRDFNLSLIDFAHKVCLIRNPRCSSCILSVLCDYNNKK